MYTMSMNDHDKICSSRGLNEELLKMTFNLHVKKTIFIDRQTELMGVFDSVHYLAHYCYISTNVTSKRTEKSRFFSRKNYTGASSPSILD